MLKLAALLVLALMQSCAATFGTGPFMVPIASDPPGALVSYEGASVGVTPCTVAMYSRCSQVNLRLAGHHPRTAEMGSTSNANWVALGFLMWGPFEIIVDASKDAFTGVDIRPVVVPMVVDTQSAPAMWTRPDEDTVTEGSLPGRRIRWTNR